MKAHMICHTHWDREWYFTREEFRTKLIRLIDGLLEIIDEVPGYVSFMLDGQTIAIEDYLEIKPYNKEKLYAALKSGKIVCGPWYILPDELLISGESHIRNYLTGSRVLEGAAGKMKIGYLPDSFGHPAQMPQIIKGLGMDAMVFWRGTADFMEKTEFFWESPAKGRSCLCIHMPFGYGNSGNLSGSEEAVYERVKAMVQNLGERSSTDIVLLMNGSDHITGQKDIVEIIEKVNKRSAGEFEVELSTLENYLREVQKKLPELETYTGEFRYGHRSMLLGGTLSTRMYLKQMNNQVQKAAEQYIEPVMAAEWLLGGTSDNRGYLRYLWKKILENHPHDSICGCSIDAVHEEMETRFQSVSQLEKKLFEDTVDRIAVLAEEEQEGEGVTVLLFEPSQDRLPSCLELTVDMDRMLVQEVDFAKSIIVDYESQIVHPDLPTRVMIRDEEGRELPCRILKAEKGYTTRYQDHTMPEVYKSNQLKLCVLLPGYTYGFHTLNIKRIAEAPEVCQAVPAEAAEKPAQIENEFYKIWFEQGAFTVWDKKENKMHKGVHRFIDKGDAGDEYTYSWPETDEVYGIDESSVEIETEQIPGIRQSLSVKANLRLPKALEETRKSRVSELVDCPVAVTVRLIHGIDRIDFQTTVTNCAKDHRLQVQFPSGIRTSYTEAEDVFHITRRQVEAEIPKTWAEYPQSTHPIHGFANVENEDGGMAVMAGGIAEFEGVQEDAQTCLNLTLLRCVGWLSRTDLITREGNGGWTIETPGAQCMGTYEFSYSIAYHTGNWRSNQVYQVLDKASKPCAVYQIGCKVKEDKIGQMSGFLSELPGQVRLSALKLSEDGKGLILRFYHIGEEAEYFPVRVPKGIQNVWAVNLAEEPLAEIPVEDESVSLRIQPHQIITIKMS